ncbi:MAG TPA: outer membrane lipoprotein carrier protein LolA [Longimicrobiales bacterium]|nr:outer membrane lipoprotein carrier protein LolA [Longimicrobiales bacterium]
MRSPLGTPILSALVAAGFAVLSTGLLPGDVRAQQSKATAAIAAAADRYTEISALCADFEQSLVSGVLGRETRSEGRLCQARPNLFEMDFSDPEGDRIVVDGEHVWVWYRSINPETVLRVALDPTRGGFDFYREFLSDPLQKYEVSGGNDERIGGVETVRVSLEPRESRGYEGAEVWIDPETDLIRRIAIREENGNVRTVTLSDIDLAPAIPDRTFVFEVPEGVSVAGPRGGVR